MQLFAQILVLGIILGGIYGLLGAGLNLLFGVMRVVNFAHGAFATAGGYASYYAVTAAGLPPVAGIVAAIAAGAVLGFLVDAVLLRSVHEQRVDRPEDYTLILMFAVSLMLTAGSASLFGADFKKPPGFWDGAIDIGWLRITGNRLITFGAAVVLTVVLALILYRSDVGRAWRALSQNQVGAKIVGIDVKKMSHLAWAFAGGLAAAAGALLAPIYTVYPTSGDPVLVKSFIVVVLGGLGSVIGALGAGLLIGIVEAFGAAYGDAAFTDAYGFAFMILVLLIAPNGLFGHRSRAL